MGRTAISWGITEKGPGLDALKARLKREISGGSIHVKAGFLGGSSADRPSEGITNPELAAVHEFGAPEVGIPARPHTSPAFDNNRPKYEGQLRQVLGALMVGPVDVRGALNLIGMGMAADIRNYVTQGPPIQPENSTATKARKEARTVRDADGRPVGEVRTLVDTGRMIGSVSWAVEKGRAGK